jgi:CRISPR-associated endonuclease/helicase Cas3
LAKSGKRPSSRFAYAEACRRAGLKIGARHEVASLAFIEDYFKTAKANDAELVLWLVGTHHGYGRPFFPPVDWPGSDCERIEVDFGEGPRIATSARSMAVLTAQWIDLAERVQRRYGPWGLARLEAILRLADHRQSEFEADEADSRSDQKAISSMPREAVS